MATFDVETGELWKSAQASETLSGSFGRLASVLGSYAGSADATGNASSTEALRSFITQWSKELAAESEAFATMAHDLRAAAAIYESTEIFAADSFSGGPAARS